MPVNKISRRSLLHFAVLIIYAENILDLKALCGGAVHLFMLKYLYDYPQFYRKETVFGLVYTEL